ncbi:MAG TPA: galactokinase [Candidatus Dormibacteraeota bacterium]
MAFFPARVSDSQQVQDQTRAAFRTTFGHAPQSVAVAPGRMNIIGEHTDYNQGFVMPAAIDRHVGAAITLRADDRVIVRSDQYSDAVDLPGLPERRTGGWADYVFGVAREVRRHVHLDAGFELALASHLPIGSGLSSSGALEVAVALSMLQATRVHLEAIEIARLCQTAENDFIGARTGIMDQFTALCARAGAALLLDCRSVTHEYVPLPGTDYAWLLADTRVHHELASSEYNQRRAECEAAAKALDKPSLRDVVESELDAIQDPVLRRRARHVVTENARVLHAAGALRRGAVEELGPLLYASHTSLRVDFEVSCAELDALVVSAHDLPEIIGARMMGGGFGGCVLVLLAAGAINLVERHLAEAYQREFHRSPGFYRVRSVDGVMPGHMN